jgi:hypothetical protein
MRIQHIAVGALLCAAAAAPLRRCPATPAGEPRSAPAATVAEPTAPAPAIPAVGEPSTDTSRAGGLRLPDGTSLPPLNGAIDPPPMVWSDDTPFSPVVGVQHDPGGCDWYVHADGSRSTTVSRPGPDGRLLPWTIVAHPIPAVAADRQ